MINNTRCPNSINVWGQGWGGVTQRNSTHAFTWNGKARETHSQNQECNGNTFCMREANYQQQSGLHAKPWWSERSKTPRRKEKNFNRLIGCLFRSVEGHLWLCNLSFVFCFSMKFCWLSSFLPLCRLRYQKVLHSHNASMFHFAIKVYK